MTAKSMLELLAQADATLPDNTTQEITAADVRNMIKDFIDSVTPGYGVVQIVSQALTLNATTPTPLAPASSTNTTPTIFAASAAQGSVQRTLNGVAGSTIQIIASGDISGNNGNEVTVRLFQDGNPTNFVQTVSTTGAANNNGFNIAAIVYVANDAVFDLRAVAPAGTYTFRNVSLVAQAQPVRSFV